MLDERTHKKAHFESEKVFANGITLAASGEIQSLWEGDMNISRFGVRAKVYVAATAGTLLLSAVASADQPALQFKGGIGVIPVSSVTGCPASNPCATGTPVAINRNIVRGVAPPGQIWVIDELDATVNTNGRIKVKGQGLILGGGDNAGRAPALSVLASLFCGTGSSLAESRTASAGVELSPTGDFQINDMLAPVPPTTCDSPMLLIRSTGTGNPWFAVGIFRPGH